MSILRLYLRTGWPDSEPGLPWALLDAQGQCQRHGDDVPAQWPRANQLELVLPAGMTLFTRVALPDGRELKPAVIGYALEEQLGNDPAANLYVLGGKASDGQRHVAVCEAAPVRRAVAMLRQLGWLADRIVPEEILLPLPEADEWLLAFGDGGVLVRCDRDQAFYLRITQPEQALLLLPRLAANGMPARLRIMGEIPPAIAQQWACESAPAYDWQQGVARGVNFANGELAADKHWRKWRPVLRRSAGIALGLLVLQTLILLGQWGWLSWQKQQLSKEIRTLSQPLVPQALPGSAALPMLRAVDRLRLAHGESARDGMLALMGELAQVNREQIQLQTLQYDSGRLAFVAPQLSAEQVKSWQALLAARQIRLLRGEKNEQGQQWLLSREP